ncbi:hypothetical protein BWQ96_04625 [Gracilariopsis chorda]|uniref:Uncharacterized protein n=1 Tax=Gracilariopsis chorda TaxID=448386 RepID=A0A2V3IWV4_9FLOR|nr:hypothetical protein BWQ96_04625 [Gracilariopsis chorda]|eukprot:PXF45620.1 hypothetical protein BWQ96_04625 [Gracilariopsis chorda]
MLESSRDEAQQLQVSAMQNFYTASTMFFQFMMKAVASLLSALLTRRKPRLSLFPITKPWFEGVISIFSDRDFERAFRMSRKAFDQLEAILTTSVYLWRHLVCQERRISLRVKIAIVIGMMAGASFYDLMLLYEVSGTSIRRCFNQFVNVFLDVMSLPGLPKDEQGL